MCGIFALLNYRNEEEPTPDLNEDKNKVEDKDKVDERPPINKNSDQGFIKEQFEKGQNRGPEFSEIVLHEEEQCQDRGHVCSVFGQAKCLSHYFWKNPGGTGAAN